MAKKPAQGLVYSVLDRDDTLLSAVTSTGAGTAVEGTNTPNHIFQAFLAATTTPTATVLVQGSLDGTNYVTIATLSLSGSADNETASVNADWPYIRGNVTAIAGTSAAVTLLMRS